MNDIALHDVVHEAEAQRQYPRVRIPGQLHVEEGGKDRRYRLHDLSAGGLCFETKHTSLRVGSRLDGRLEITVTPVRFSMPVHCEVRNISDDGKRVGCAFIDLGPGEISALRRLVHGTLTGELVSMGEVIAALSRDNFVKARDVNAAGEGLTGSARARAILATTLMFALGLIAFAYAANKLYEVAFVTRAAAAKIAAPTFNVAMPRDGTFFDLVPESGVVKKGQPVAAFQAAMLDVIQGDIGSLKFSPGDLSQLMGETLKGTLSSPCDCRVQRRSAIDGQYVNRGQPLFELIPDNAKPYVLARFHFETIDKLPVGHSVSFQIYGDSGQYRGKISDVRLLQASSTTGEPGASDIRGLNNAGTVSDVLATITPDKPLDPALIDRPVNVTLGETGSLVAMLFKPVKEQ